MYRFAVIGGGISGLVAARTLKDRLPDAEVVLFEAGPRLGGKISTVQWPGGRIEEGADSFLANGGELPREILELGLQDDLVSPAIFAGSVWSRGRLYRLPPENVMGLPLSAKAARGTGILTWRGALRAGLERFHMKPLAGPDVSVGSFVRTRFGIETLDRMVDPLLAGTRAGDPARMSLAAALPQVDLAARRGRSVTRVLRSGRRSDAKGPAGPAFFSFRDGMRTLVEELEQDLVARGASIVTGSPVTEVHHGRQGLRLLPDDGGSAFHGIVIATPAPTAATLLNNVAPASSKMLETFSYSSVASVALAFDDPVPDGVSGSGVLVPSNERRKLAAVTWFTRKWAGVGSPSTWVARCFIGRGGSDEIDRDDDHVERAALSDLRDLLASDLEPVHSRVTRWRDGLPRYEVGHLERVEAAERGLGDLPIVLAGASYRGSGVPDCMTQGRTAAQRLFELVRT